MGDAVRDEKLDEDALLKETEEDEIEEKEKSDVNDEAKRTLEGNKINHKLKQLKNVKTVNVKM